MIPVPELVRRTLAEGAFHFGPLVQRHSDYIFGLNMRLTSGNRALAQDITQQTFLNAFTYLKSFDRTKAFKHWIAGIAVNCFKDAIKKENVYVSADAPNFSNASNPYKPSLEGFHTPEPEMDSAFLALIEPLNMEERALVILRFVYEFKIAEIGELMTLNAGTVKSKLSRATQKLGKLEQDAQGAQDGQDAPNAPKGRDKKKKVV
jgi:RNA polymerase sigma-70 factor (ECF subfamily)